MDYVDAAVRDIRSLAIQGATNVALATLNTLERLIAEHKEISCYELTRYGEQLANARPTEPLAQNAVRYISQGCTAEATARIARYRAYIEEGKQSIPGHGLPTLTDGGTYLTLCHSSTTVRLFTMARSRGVFFSLYVAETRPRFQGRTTANDLIAAGFDDVTMVIDDVAISLIEGRRGKIDAVFIGADLLTAKGFVNKVGSLALAAAARRKHIPVYVLTTLLKFDPGTFTPTRIEQRDPLEIWEDAPETLKFYAPAFDYVPFYPNVHVICEEGVIPGKIVATTAKKRYPFIFDIQHDRRLHYGKSV